MFAVIRIQLVTYVTIAINHTRHQFIMMSATLQSSGHYSIKISKIKESFTVISSSLVRKYCVIELYASEFSDRDL
jgi:hypothetical protein